MAYFAIVYRRVWSMRFEPWEDLLGECHMVCCFIKNTIDFFFFLFESFLPEERKDDRITEITLLELPTQLYRRQAVKDNLDIVGQLRVARQ